MAVRQGLTGLTCPSGAARHLPINGEDSPALSSYLPIKGEELRTCLARAAAAGAKALDLPGLGRRHVVRTASHLAHKTLLLNLATELTQGLLELLGILDDYSHNPSRIQTARDGLRC
jgi:hypothetical protein